MFENRVLKDYEIQKLHENYQSVIYCYKNVTGRGITHDELTVLKVLIQITTPAIINKMIYRFHKQYPENFQSLHYLYQPVKNMFKNKKRSSRY